MGYSVQIDEQKCIGCGKCVAMCPRRILMLEDGKARATDPNACDGLAGCIRKCSTDAITIKRIGRLTN